MTKSLEKFSFEGAPVRVMERNGITWWVLADVCAVLAIRNARDAADRLDDDEKGVATTDTLGGSQEMTVINESGLWSLVLTSRKPQAKRLKKWVTAEVLPSIRKTGQYGSAVGISAAALEQFRTEVMRNRLLPRFFAQDPVVAANEQVKREHDVDFLAALGISNPDGRLLAATSYEAGQISAFVEAFVGEFGVGGDHVTLDTIMKRYYRSAELQESVPKTVPHGVEGNVFSDGLAKFLTAYSFLVVGDCFIEPKPTRKGASKSWRVNRVTPRKRIN
ncbi:BRO-N domain-containing protein [Asaia astilbis]|uniref:BRO-N domain-containing protein n=1 Tax=Asaia astilbis TaxID=610244 RepID=UPI0004726EAB|nr:BRO family protein [Asaia astilbis]